MLPIAADPALATQLGAGLHWPERLLPARRSFEGLTTAAAHGAEGIVRAVEHGADACLLGPVFATRSSSGNRPLGAFRASQLARGASLPVIALGGVTLPRARTLAGRGFAGLAAIDAFLKT
jgi:thiamine-phosphate pyrophosphorylase